MYVDFDRSCCGHFCFLFYRGRTKIVFGAPYTMLANTFFSALASIVWCYHYTKKGV